MEPTQGTVLVVDDEKNIRRMLRQTLEGAGYGVLEAETADGRLYFLPFARQVRR